MLLNLGIDGKILTDLVVECIPLSQGDIGMPQASYSHIHNNILSVVERAMDNAV